MSKIKEARNALDPIFKKARMYRSDPLKHPHNLSFEEIQEMEMLHYHLSVFLYRLHGGDWYAKLQKRKVTFEEFSEEMERVIESNTPPYRPY